jgi:orotidine-5'-phosphate decarboxylase
MFIDKLNNLILKKKSLLCIGIDTDIEKIPSFLLSELDPLYRFNKAIIEATKDFAVAFKLNIAFYESLSIPGWELLEKTLSIMPSDVLVIADAKRADIANTSKKYAETFFRSYPFDGITVSPYMGFDSILPFLNFQNKGIFILCLTSNSGAQDFQFLKVENEYLFQNVARKVVEWNFQRGNCGLVVGGTHTDQMKLVRQIAPNLPFLVPGIGKQGGNLELAVKYSTDSKGLSSLITASRSVIYASSDEEFADSSRQSAKHLKDQINRSVGLYKNPSWLGLN